MKNRFFNPYGVLVCGVMLCVASCEKMVLTEEAGASLSAVTRSNAGVYTRLNFVVFDDDGERVDQINQEVGDDDFGEAHFTLPLGTYRLALVAHSAKGNPSVNKRTFDNDGQVKKHESISFTNDKGFTDTFLYYGNVTITDEPEDLGITLRRIVSLCRFEVTDEFPEDVDKMRFYYTGGSGTFDATTGLGSVDSKQTAEFKVISGKKQFDLYTFLRNTEGSIHLTVTAMDDSGNVINERSFDVPMKQNYVTCMTGPFFAGGGTGSTGITITINTDWAGENHITF